MPSTFSLVSRLLDHHDLPGARVVETNDAASFASIEHAAREAGLATRSGRLRSYDALARLELLPAVVSLRKRTPGQMFALRDDGTLDDVGSSWSYELLHRADATGVDLEHPERGRYRMSRADFAAAWRGTILCFAGPRRRPSRIPRSARVALAALAAASLGICLGPAGLRPALAAALLASVWATLTGQTCAACRTARRRVPMSLGPIGIAGYGLLLVAGPALVPLLCAAAGIHLTLVARLAHHRLRCAPCLATALAAWLATGAGCALAPAAIVALPIAALATHVAIRSRPDDTTDVHDAVRGLLADRPASASPTMVIYKADGCPACEHVERTLLPQLAAQLGDGLRIELRQLRAQLPAPTIVVFGPRASVALLGSPDRLAVDDALALSGCAA